MNKNVFLKSYKKQTMKQVHFLCFFLILSVTTSFTSCSKDNDETTATGISNQSWIEGTPVEITTGSVLSVSFKATADWQATAGSDWCEVLTPTGNKGASTLRLTVSTSTATDRTTTITIKSEGYASVNFIVKQAATQVVTVSENQQVNEQVDNYLKKNYLWNDEYKGLSLDYTKSYDSFFYDALGSMTTNTLDKRSYTGSDNQTHYSLFSYIEKKNTSSSTRSIPQVQKDQEYSFGITGAVAVKINSKNGYYAFCIQGVYPDSPASKAGIKRGSYISQINNSQITQSNYNTLFLNLLYPKSATSLSLTELFFNEDNSTATQEISITAQAMYKNPILYQDVITSNGHPIGYLVYSGFDAGFDDLLYEVFKNFKSKGIEDLVLDLRYNGGGHVISANLIASCIAGSYCKGKVFAKYRYNDERMKEFNGKKPEEQFKYDNYSNLGSSLSAGGLGLKHVYCLVGKPTASASELVINSLRGIDIETVLIGEKTTGKNVGMEPHNIIVGQNTYEVVPITFQSYNAKDYGNYESGFEPDIILDETDADNDNFFEGYIDYGNLAEPLLSRAIQEIIGLAPTQTRSLSQMTPKGKAVKTPVIFRPGRDGMIKEYE
ncbi:peptidase S41 [Bacteroides helcogenes P 36-108]|uniref:Peptidase S41 n=2 Tax=Bacteroides helcogenes TaxID=290053 RepID=E6STE9_BACT6|nr:peptidase S41 [Bacteroides helcogenes P 36-108]